MKTDAANMGYKELNDCIRKSKKKCEITGCIGQRFIAAGMGNKEITIDGIPGNALGAYLSGAEITVNGNAQDAVGDTMGSGKIIVHGNIGDAAGYAMRGGEIYIRGNAGYRAGIHMKAYKEKKPAIIIGGRAGSFLGEYQAGGIIVVLGLNEDGRPIVSNYPCTGMHGGKMFLRGNVKNIRFPSQTTAKPATAEDMKEIKPYIENFCKYFGFDTKKMLNDKYTVITPDSKNPYHQMYVAN